ncbi:MAG: hypothetical protein JXA28_08390 [Bacteroidetes bacterium]|nr:hypothetical protein [Bacteroidota bacterium]
METIHSGYIRTPAELDAAAHALERSLGQTSSPIKRFLLVAEFASHTQALPQSWLTGYVPVFAPMLVELVRMPYLRNVPPQVWIDAYDFLLLVRSLNWDVRIPGFEDALERTLLHTILAHAFVSSLRELHGFFLAHGSVTRKLEEGEWTQIFGASNTSLGLFEKYAETLQSISVGIRALMDEAFSVWVEFRTRPDAVSIILLDDEVHSRYAAGRVVLMDIVTHDAVEGESHLSNLLGESGHELVAQLHRAENFASEMLRERFRVSVAGRRFHYSVHESSAALIGGSLGLPALAGVMAQRTRRMNLREYWVFPTTVGSSGRIGAEGQVEAGSWEVLEVKLRLAFFSPLERVVIPAAHREAALHAIQMLQRDYPNRILEIIGVSQVRDLPDTEGVFQIRNRSGLERLRDVVQKNHLLLTIAIAVIVLGGGSYLLYKALYDYPNLEHARGLTVGNSAIVLNPKDSLRWCFRDGADIRSPHLPFGDLDVGDGFTRTLTVWNMTPMSLDIRLAIEGRDAADWYINSGDRRLEIATAGKRDFSVMFAPRKAVRSAVARLVLRDPDNGEELYALALSGAAGVPSPAGYALRFDGVDDRLHFGRQSSAFDIGTSATRELTFECWFRPMQEQQNFMLLHNGIDRPGERAIQDLYLGFDSLHSCYYRVGSEIGLFRLPAHLKPVAGSWNHIALAISLPQKRIALYINGRSVDDRVTDFLMDGFDLPYVTVGAFDDSRTLDLFFEGDLDEMRLWHAFLDEHEIRAFMHRRVDALTPDLAGYWDMDASVESIVFNANKRAHSGTLFGRPAPVRSDLPRHEERADYHLVQREHGRAAIELPPGRYLACMRPLLPRYGPASIALQFRQTAEPSIHFYYVRTEAGWISLEEGYSYTRVARNHVPIPEGWRHAVYTITPAGELVLYLDGAAIDTNRTVTAGPYDWHRGFEGMLLGFRFDKENQLHSSFYDWYYPTLTHPRAYADFAIWSRLLTPEEIHTMYESGDLPSEGLIAHWPLGEPPDQNRNFLDHIGGAVLHLKRVLAWEP